MVEVALALGSNIGDRENYLNSAVERIDQKVEILSISSWLENRAVGGPSGQGDFLNGALVGRTELGMFELLDFVKGIESDLGRDFEAERWSARVIDIDIVFYGSEVLNSERLTLPHPLMETRDFVLIPLAEIYSDFVHPVLNESVEVLLDKLDSTL